MDYSNTVCVPTSSRRCERSSSTQTLWEVHHAANAQVITLVYIHSLYQSFSTSSFFRVPRDGDPDPRQLFAGLDITRRQDICTEHMGKYPVIFCDFKVRVSSLQKISDNSFTRNRISPATHGRESFRPSAT